MKIFCDNCMCENEIDEKSVKEKNVWIVCRSCGHKIYLDENEFDILSNKDARLTPNSKQSHSSKNSNSVAQSDVTTAMFIKINQPTVAPPSAKLSVCQGPDSGLEIPIDIPLIIVGRRGADVNLNDQLVSRRHFSIEVVGDKYLLKDLGSTNGTYLNGKQVRVVVLSPGDEIQTGSTLFLFDYQETD